EEVVPEELELGRLEPVQDGLPIGIVRLVLARLVEALLERGRHVGAGDAQGLVEVERLDILPLGHRWSSFSQPQSWSPAGARIGSARRRGTRPRWKSSSPNVDGQERPEGAPSILGSRGPMTFGPSTGPARREIITAIIPRRSGTAQETRHVIPGSDGQEL